MEQTTSKVVVFCTYKNQSTNGNWRKSRQYNSMSELLDAMKEYLIKYPTTTVQYQWERVTQFGNKA